MAGSILGVKRGPYDWSHRGTAHWSWQGDDIGYYAMHKRLWEVFYGPARFHDCSCGKPARHWAYMHGCSDEKTGAKGQRYCVHPEHYEPLCISCHRIYDGSIRNIRDRRAKTSG